MGKRIIQQARGHGSLTYRSRKKAYKITAKYPELKEKGEAEVIKLMHVTCYNAPVAKIMFKGKVFYNFASLGLEEGQKINIGNGNKIGDIVPLKDLPIGTEIFNIESFPGSNGKFVRSSGISARIVKKEKNYILVVMPSKKEKKLHPDTRATVGIIAGAGRKEKPFVKAGKRHYKMKAIGGKIYPRSSAVKFNAVDHPFGSGRGKRIKSKISKRNSPPGAKVGHLSPRRTGKKK